MTPLRMLKDWLDRRRSRWITYRDLMSLDDRQLDDIGVPRGLIYQVANDVGRSPDTHRDRAA